MTEFWKMMAWLLQHHIEWFLIACAVLAVWIASAAVILEHIVGELRGWIAGRKERRKYREAWRE